MTRFHAPSSLHDQNGLPSPLSVFAVHIFRWNTSRPSFYHWLESLWNTSLNQQLQHPFKTEEKIASKYRENNHFINKRAKITSRLQRVARELRERWVYLHYPERHPQKNKYRDQGERGNVHPRPPLPGWNQLRCRQLGWRGTQKLAAKSL